jgi:hypothetical protein
LLDVQCLSKVLLHLMGSAARDVNHTTLLLLLLLLLLCLQDAGVSDP